MRKVTLSCGRTRTGGKLNLAFGYFAAFIMDGDTRRRDLGPVAFLQVTDFLCQWRQGQGIGT